MRRARVKPKRWRRRDTAAVVRSARTRTTGQRESSDGVRVQLQADAAPHPHHRAEEAHGAANGSGGRKGVLVGWCKAKLFTECRDLPSSDSRGSRSSVEKNIRCCVETRLRTEAAARAAKSAWQAQDPSSYKCDAPSNSESWLIRLPPLSPLAPPNCGVADTPCDAGKGRDCIVAKFRSQERAMDCQNHLSLSCFSLHSTSSPHPTHQLLLPSSLSRAFSSRPTDLDERVQSCLVVVLHLRRRVPLSLPRFRRKLKRWEVAAVCLGQSKIDCRESRVSRCAAGWRPRTRTPSTFRAAESGTGAACLRLSLPSPPTPRTPPLFYRFPPISQSEQNWTVAWSLFLLHKQHGAARARGEWRLETASSSNSPFCPLPSVRSTSPFYPLAHSPLRPLLHPSSCLPRAARLPDGYGDPADVTMGDTETTSRPMRLRSGRRVLADKTNKAPAPSDLQGRGNGKKPVCFCLSCLRNNSRLRARRLATALRQACGSPISTALCRRSIPTRIHRAWPATSHLTLPQMAAHHDLHAPHAPIARRHEQRLSRNSAAGPSGNAGSKPTVYSEGDDAISMHDIELQVRWRIRTLPLASVGAMMPSSRHTSGSLRHALSRRSRSGCARHLRATRAACCRW